MGDLCQRKGACLKLYFAGGNGILKVDINSGDLGKEGVVVC